MKIFYSCGKCCSKDEPCDKCIEDTLRGNGLPLIFKSQLIGLSHRDDSHCPPTYSPFHQKVKDLIRQTSQLPPTSHNGQG